MSSPPASTPDDTRKVFLKALDAFGHENAEKRQQGEILLDKIPKELCIPLVIEAWSRFSDARRVCQIRFLTWFLLTAIGIIFTLTGFVYFMVFARKTDDIWFFYLQATSSLFFLLPGRSLPLTDREIATIRLLQRAEVPSIVPFLLESLPACSPWYDSWSSDLCESTRQRLASLFSDFLAADLPSLTLEQQKIVRKELQVMAARLRYRAGAIEGWETEYLIGLLNLLHPTEKAA